MKAKTTEPDLTEEEARFIADSTAAMETARQRVAKHGIPAIFQTKRWREKTGFPVGVLLRHELAITEFVRRTQARRSW
jgi:hypothetical protein